MSDSTPAIPPAPAEPESAPPRAELAPVATHEDATTRATGRRPLLWPALLVFGLSLATFVRVLGNDFVNWDDLIVIRTNPRYNPPTVEALKYYWTGLTPHDEFYVPINYTVWWVLAHTPRAVDAAGKAVLRPWPFHAINWVAHAVNGVLVLLVLHRLTRSRWPSVLGALLFALHPIQAEPVAWAASMYSSVSGMFSLLAVWQYLKFSDGRGGTAAEGRRRSWAPFVLATVAYAAALLTKPTAVVVPGVVAVIELFVRGRRLRELVVPLAVWGAMTVPIVRLARASQQEAPVYTPPAAWRALIALDSLAFYLYKLVLPVGLAPDYGRSPRWLLGEGPAYYTWLAPAAVLGLAWAGRRRAPWALGCALLFVAALLPTLGLVPFDYQRYSTVADRYAYLAMLAPAAALALALARRPAPALLALATVAVGALAVLAHLQTRHWRDTDALYAHTLRVNPRSLAAHSIFGYDYARRGQPDKAMESYQRALEANPGDPRVLFNVGNLYLGQGKPAEAADAYRQAMGGMSYHAGLHTNLGMALAQLGLLDEAARELREALARDPNHAQAHTNLGTVLRAKRDWAGARRHYEAARRIDPYIPAAQRGLAEVQAAGH